MTASSTGGFAAAPLTDANFADLEELFGRPGGSIVRGCWCMFYRRTGRTTAWRDENREALRELANSDVSPGLVGYLDGTPVGWISLGPREDYLKLQRSPVMKPVDDAEVWSIVCSFVDKAHRGEGLQRRLLAAAIDYARDQGVRLLEAYAIDKDARSHDDFMFFGSRSLYERAGFKEVVRRSPTRLVMRRGLRPRRG
jgi:GNAT superfamily N-acetyltransferase